MIYVKKKKTLPTFLTSTTHLQHLEGSDVPEVYFSLLKYSKIYFLLGKVMLATPAALMSNPWGTGVIITQMETDRNQQENHEIRVSTYQQFGLVHRCYHLKITESLLNY